MLLFRYGGSLTSASNLSNGNKIGRYSFGGWVNGSKNTNLGGIEAFYVGDGTTVRSTLLGISATASGYVAGWKLDETSKFWLGDGANDYYMPTAAPSIATGDISTIVWTGNSTEATPTFVRKQRGTHSGTCDGSGDLTITFASALPDATYLAFAQSLTVGTAVGTVHTKAAGSMKVRFYNPLTGVACASCAVAVDYDVEDN